MRSAPTSLSLRTEERVAYAGVKNELKFSIPEMPGCGSTDRELQREHSPAVVSKKPICRVTDPSCAGAPPAQELLLTARGVLLQSLHTLL